MDVLRRIRNVGNWANGSTLLGLGVARLGGCTLRRGDNGLWLAEEYRPQFPVAGAFTVGCVLITASHFDDLERLRPGTLQHEENHTWQWTYCAGLPFLALYSVATGWSWLTTGDRAAGNFFECQAGLAIGGYREAPRRPLSQGIRDLRDQLARRRARGPRPQ